VTLLSGFALEIRGLSAYCVGVGDGRTIRRRGVAVPRLATALVAVCVFGAAAAAFVFFLRPHGPTTRVILSPDRLADTATQPYCDQRHGFCISQPSAGAYEALVPLDTHPVFRAKGCPLAWRPHMVWSVTNGVEGPPYEPGLFVSGCSGAKFDIAGAWLFGPAARQMDRLPLAVRADGSVVVSLEPVIPGTPLYAVAAAAPPRP
jgi:hypothetical protein